MTAHDTFREDLPIYAVGALPPDEARAIEEHLAGCPECREELHELQHAAAQIALAIDAVPPPGRLEQRLLAEIEAEGARPPMRAGRPAPQPKRTFRRTSPSFWLPALGAVLLAIVAATLWARVRELAHQNVDLAEKMVATDESLRQTQALVDMLTSSDVQRVTLVEAGQNPKPEARTIYSPKLRSLVLLASHLPPLATDKTYELWLLPANGGAPLPEGTFTPDAHGSASLVLTQLSDVPAKGFAITAEMKPGSATPTLPILLSGAS